MNEFDIRPKRNPREKKLLDSKRIRMKYRYMRRLGRPLEKNLGEDESGFPVFLQTYDYRHTFTVKAVRRHKNNCNFHANGRGFTYHRDYYEAGKSSRVGMRRKQEWHIEAQETLKEQQ